MKGVPSLTIVSAVTSAELALPCSIVLFPAKCKPLWPTDNRARYNYKPGLRSGKEAKDKCFGLINNGSDVKASNCQLCPSNRWIY